MNEGLDMFKLAITQTDIEELIEQGIEVALEMPGVWGPNTEWANFAWGFGNAWRDSLHHDEDISATFSLQQALTSSQLNYVAKKMGITQKYSDYDKTDCDKSNKHLCPKEIQAEALENRITNKGW